MPKASAKPSTKTASVAVLAKSKPIDLEKLDAGQVGSSFRFDAKEHGKRAVAMIAHVEGLKKERSMKAILAGIFLHQVKLSLEHGEFEAWMSEHLGKTARTGRNYMALAAKFSRSTRLILPELVGANQLSLDLTAKNDDGRAVLVKLEKFVGSKGLTELMQQHEVIKQGGARPAPATTTTSAPGGADDGAGEPTVDEAEDAARSTGLEAVETAHKALMNDVLWHDLTPENAALIEGKLKTLADCFHARLLKLKHAAAA
ncbi:MAG: hypothetical protein K0R17_2267 [Rariglobus sp.]|jgi:hypothetical protein|nr:hypothetical protein [Rariglobus sp.]